MADARVYEIINPSDAVTLETANELAAIAVALLLGRGAYGLRRDDDETVCPLMLFADADKTEAWLVETFGQPLGEWIDAHEQDVIACFESALYCGLEERRAFDAAFEGLAADDKLARLAKFNDEKRSSMNDIGAACHTYARQLRARQKATG